MKPQLLKGTRDFLPEQISKRKYIFNTIEKVFKKYAFAQIETPAMEALATLSGKYGDEGDKLLFKILNNGDFLEKADENALTTRNSYALASSIAKRGLRYDLTVPFARFVVLHQNEITFPFKRYQIQPVWRADRPQKGRYQEFYQCDADVVGSDSLIYEAELASIYHEVFKALGISVDIKINNRKILFGIAEAVGIEDKFMDMTVAIDKLDKIGADGVEKELLERGITAEQAKLILEMLSVKSHQELKAFFKEGSEGLKGVAEIESVFQLSKVNTGLDNLKYDVKLARGLSYYTGCIFEVALDKEVHPEITMGSIGGGGRYDNLTGSFGMPGLSGVGISFGAERIYDVLEELNLFPADVIDQAAIVMMAFDDQSLEWAFYVGQMLRNEGIAVDVYPDPGKLKKQIKYAADKKVKYAGIIGEEEVRTKTISLKNLISGEQMAYNLETLTELLKQEK
ncbi:MAG: histidine--tRNA ligase [Saprospiraceae bacterium]|nr:histidine--tRNA ligase [Saprospiraceae bacterium]